MNFHDTTDPSDDGLFAASHWCMLLSEGDLSLEEWAAFDEWHSQPGNAALLEQVSATWQFCGEIGNEPEIIPHRTAALTDYHRANRRRWRPSVIRMWPRSALMAASVAVMAVFGATFIGSEAETYATTVGERRIAQLDDGSQMSIDAASELTVSIDDDVRSVALVRGRAKFNVAHDPLRPFAVEAGDKLIVAIGTSFSVEIIGDEVRVILYQGTVEIRDRTDHTVGKPAPGKVRQLLTPGQLLIDPVTVSGPGKVVPVNQGKSLSWESGMLSFTDEPLSLAVERVNRYSSRKVVLQGSGIRSIEINGEYRAGDVNSFLEGVAAVHDLDVVSEGGQLGLRRQ